MKIGFYFHGWNHSIDKYFQIFEILDRMIFDERFIPVLLFDDTGLADEDVKKIYDGKCEFKDLRSCDIDSLGLSAYIAICPYSAPIRQYRTIRTPLIYKEYGVAGVEKGTGFLMKKSVYKNANLIITDNEFTRDNILKMYPDKDVVVGSPAFDYVFSDRYWILDRLREGRDHVHVLWTPHHSMYSSSSFDQIEGGVYSTFPEFKDYLTGEFLEEFPNVVLHIKFHPILGRRYTGYCRKNHIHDNFNRFLNTIKDNPRIKIHDNEDFHDLFAETDICINDSLSFLQEYLPTFKPMIVLDSGCKYSPYGEEIVNQCYTRVKGVEEFRVQFKNFLGHSLQDYAENRRRVVSSLYIGSKPNSEYLLNIIYRRFSRQ